MTTLTQILDRLDTVLQANAIAGTKVLRERTDAESRDEVPSINVLARDDDCEPFAGEMDKHMQSVELRFHVRDAVPTPVAEAQHAAVHRSIVNDATLLGICDSVRHMAATFEREEADLTTLIKSVRYRFTYLIPQNTL